PKEVTALKRVSSQPRLTTATTRCSCPPGPATMTHSSGSDMIWSSTILGSAAFSREGDSGGTWMRSKVTSLAASSSTTRCASAIASASSGNAAEPSRSIASPRKVSANGQGNVVQCCTLSAAALEGTRIYSVLKSSLVSNSYKDKPSAA